MSKATWVGRPNPNYTGPHGQVGVSQQIGAFELDPPLQDGTAHVIVSALSDAMGIETAVFAAAPHPILDWFYDMAHPQNQKGVALLTLDGVFDQSAALVELGYDEIETEF